MAAFSYQQHHHHLLLDPVYFPNPPMFTYKNNSGFSDQPTAASAAAAAYFPQFHQPEPPLPTMSMDFSSTFQESSCLEQNAKVMSAISNNYEASTVVNKLQSPDSSSVVLDQKLESGEQVSEKVTMNNSINPMDKKRKCKNGSSFNSAQSKDTRELIKCKKPKKGSNLNEDQKKPRPDKKKVAEEAPTGYIHVRARRGQATDSHSLAERVRREKISERMKQLQALVPGCDKVTGKALMLDEIINYIQSLQNQVEFLSMKLAFVNPMLYDFGVDLDAFMVNPQDLNSLGVPPLMPNVQQCSATNSSFPTAANNINNNYPLVDTSASLIFQQEAVAGHIPNILSQGNGQVLWDITDEPRQKLINQSAPSNTLCSFH